MAVYLGIDPGAKGALCFLHADLKKLVFLPTPGEEITPLELRKLIIATHNKYPIVMAGIEDVHSIYGMSAKSNFQFGFNVGILHGIIRTTNIGVDLVTPKEWQKTIKLPTAKSVGGPAKLKKRIAEIALRLYPDAPLYGPRGGLLDGKADALMIAHHLALKYGGLR